MCYENEHFKIEEEHNVNIPKPDANKAYIKYDGINHFTYWTPKIKLNTNMAVRKPKPTILTTTSRTNTTLVPIEMKKNDTTNYRPGKNG